MQDVQQSSNGVATAPAETTSSDVDAFLTQITKEEEEALHILENEEDEIKRLERREREMHQAYLERVARFERTEQTRIHKIEAALTAQQERRAKRVRDADTQRHALLDYDDDLEREKGEHEYYRERSRWIRQRVAHARREMDKDAEDRRAEAHEAALAARAAYEATRAEREAAAKARAEEEARLAALRAEEERLERLRREREEQRREVYHAVASGGHGIVVGRIMTMEERKAAIQELVAQLPTEWEAICVWDVKWDFLEGGGDVLQGKLKEFVGKKVVETLKEENADIVDFVMKSVGRRKGAQYLLDELSGPLEEDAEIFVKKLWRMVMFESESRARGLA
ncbi:hypothetical protein BC830DRAFT_1175295 [Chytriomyces sp. MP71]|nr:hypothetical protein BC830DRAFT_1175295 [Chytriomyces sp. MP71]